MGLDARGDMAKVFERIGAPYAGLRLRIEQGSERISMNFGWLG